MAAVLDAPPTRAALRYYGGKWRLAPWILQHFPPHECYVEPFCGALSVLLQKAPARYETANDLDGEVVNFFRILRDAPEAFRAAVELTPYSRAEVDLACEPLTGTEDALERARRFYVRSWQSIHGAPSRGRMGWRYEAQGSRGWSKTVVDSWQDTAGLLAIAERLRRVQFECDDAVKVMARFDRPGTLFYVDPPYVASTRSERWATAGYVHELRDDEHAALANVLRSLRGMVVLSGYDCPLYQELYPDWRRVTRRAAVQDNGVATESLWLSPNMERALVQRDLFAWEAGE